MKHDKYIEECSTLLAALREEETDCLLPYFIQIQHIAEEINYAFNLNTALELSQLDSVHVEPLWKRYGQELRQLEMSITEDIWNNGELLLFPYREHLLITSQVHVATSYYATRIYLNEVGFHAKSPSSIEIMTPSHHAWYNSSLRSEILISSLQASKDYLDHFISLPSDTFYRMTITDLLHLIYAVLVLGRFVTGCDAPILDVAKARKAANMEYYLNSLISLLDPLIIPADAKPEGELVSFVWHIRRIFKQTKVWHNQILADPLDGTFPPVREISFMEILPSVIGRCVDFSGAAGSQKAASPFLADKWMDMLAEWPPLELDASVLDSTMTFIEGSKEALNPGF